MQPNTLLHKSWIDMGLNTKMFAFHGIKFLMEIKVKIKNCDLIKLKLFCKAQEIINKVKRQSTEWEKIFANEATGKRLISKIYKQLTQLN